MRHGRSKFLDISEKKIVPKEAQCSETDFSINFAIFCFETLSILYAIFVVNYESDSETLTSDIKGFNPKASGQWGVAPHKLLDLGGRYSPDIKKNLNSSSRQCTTNVEHKIEHIANTKIANCKIEWKFCLRTLLILWDDIFYQKILRILNDHVSRTKNRKIYFLFDLKHCATFWTEKIGSFFEEGGGRGSACR